MCNLNPRVFKLGLSESIYIYLQFSEKYTSKLKNESSYPDPEPAQDEREGVGCRGVGHQELLAHGVQGLGLELPRGSPL